MLIIILLSTISFSFIHIGTQAIPGKEQKIRRLLSAGRKSTEGEEEEGGLSCHGGE